MSKSYMVVIYTKVPYMVARALVLIEKLGFFKVQVVVEHAAQQSFAPDAFCECPPETRTSNVNPRICPVCEKPRR